MRRGEVWWASLRAPQASEPGYRRPVLIVQSDAFNRSRIATVVAVALSSNLRLAEAPGNVLLTARSTGLHRNSVANVSHVITVDRRALAQKVRRLSESLMRDVDAGLRLVLSL